jgi:hypothetical protein
MVYKINGLKIDCILQLQTLVNRRKPGDLIWRFKLLKSIKLFYKIDAMFCFKGNDGLCVGIRKICCMKDTRLEFDKISYLTTCLITGMLFQRALRVFNQITLISNEQAVKYSCFQFQLWFTPVFPLKNNFQLVNEQNGHCLCSAYNNNNNNKCINKIQLMLIHLLL